MKFRACDLDEEGLASRTELLLKRLSVQVIHVLVRDQAVHERRRPLHKLLHADRAVAGHVSGCCGYRQQRTRASGSF